MENAFAPNFPLKAGLSCQTINISLPGGNARPLQLEIKDPRSTFKILTNIQQVHKLSQPLLLPKWSAETQPPTHQADQMIGALWIDARSPVAKMEISTEPKTKSLQFPLLEFDRMQKSSQEGSAPKFRFHLQILGWRLHHSVS